MNRVPSFAFRMAVAAIILFFGISCLQAQAQTPTPSPTPSAETASPTPSPAAKEPGEDLLLLPKAIAAICRLNVKLLMD